VVTAGEDGMTGLGDGEDMDTEDVVDTVDMERSWDEAGGEVHKGVVSEEGTE